MILTLLDNGLPASEILDYFVNCLVSLVELLCSGFSSCEGYVHFSFLFFSTVEKIHFMPFVKSFNLILEPENYML
jgi:hypothetical protein